MQYQSFAYIWSKPEKIQKTSIYGITVLLFRTFIRWHIFPFLSLFFLSSFLSFVPFKTERTKSIKIFTTYSWIQRRNPEKCFSSTQSQQRSVLTNSMSVIVKPSRREEHTYFLHRLINRMHICHYEWIIVKCLKINFPWMNESCAA